MMKTVKCDPKSILLVDDDSDILISLQTFIEGSLPGYSVLTANNGNKAVELWEKHMPGVSIIDMMLPGRSGFLVTEKIKHPMSSYQGRKVPPIVIMITGNPGKRHEMYGESLGVFEYFVKPIKLPDLLASIRRALVLCGEKPPETKPV